MQINLIKVSLSNLVIILSIYMPNISCATTANEQATINTFISTAVAKTPYTKVQLNNIFKKITLKPSIIEVMEKPAEKKLMWHQYRKIFINDKRIKAGIRFMQENSKPLDIAQKKYGVPKSVITAIIGVETYYGKIRGRHKVIDSLSTLAFIKYRRNKFFQRELIHFLNFTHKYSLDVFVPTGSYAGAMGYGQFMPSSVTSFAVDADNNGIIDLFSNPLDAIGSVANYFNKHKWQPNKLVAIPLILLKNKQVDMSHETIKPNLTLGEIYKLGFIPNISSSLPHHTKAALIVLEKKNSLTYWAVMDNFYVISRYNRSKLYSMAVYQLSQAIASAAL
jgi:membrane-bound lytic murein transglycosylase B